jgi:hypothetical protein
MTSFPNVIRGSSCIYAIPREDNTGYKILKRLGKGGRTQGEISIGNPFPWTTVGSDHFTTAVYGSTTKCKIIQRLGGTILE